jgi:carbonic anhydrase
MADPSSISNEQLAAFPFQNNFRPPQPLYSRQIDYLSPDPAVMANKASTFHWEYENDGHVEGSGSGPNKWGRYYPACNGRSQSPININLCKVATDSGAKNMLALSWLRVTGLSAKNTGHTIQIDYAAGSKTVFENEAGWLVKQFHFHKGSENRIDGRQMALELHIVHTRDDPTDTRLLVVGVLFDIAPTSNAWLDTLGWGSLPTTSGASALLPSTFSSVLGALPAARDYYQWKGSLTTPPCTEGVQWVLFRAVQPISQAQADAFPFANNARPTQPLYDRVVTLNSLRGASTEPPSKQLALSGSGRLWASTQLWPAAVLSLVALLFSHY